MKLVKLSLAAIAVVGLATSSFAADTLADAFKNGKLKGELKAYYFDKETASKDASIITTGIQLNYVTDYFYGFKLGATFQSSASPFSNDEAKDLFKGDMYGSGAVVSEGYLAYTFSKTTAKVGRQFIKSPLIASSGSRLIKESFEGATIVTNAIPGTKLFFTYVDKYQSRTDNAGNIDGFDDVGEDGAYSVGVVNKSIKGLTLTAQYLDMDAITAAAKSQKAAAILYAEVKYAGKASNFSYNAGIQYNDSDYELDTSKDSDFYAAKVGVGISGFKAYIAYSKTGDDNGAHRGLGKGPNGTYYTKSVIGSAVGIIDKAGAEAIAIDANYAMSGAKAGLRYIDISANNDYEENRFNIYGSYAFAGALKGLKTDIVYEDQSRDAKREEFWFKAVYKF